MGDEARTKKKIFDMFNFLSKEIMPDRKKAKWWNNPLDGQSPEYFHQVPLKLALIHSEVTEALEAHRRSYIDNEGNIVWQPDDKLPHVNGLTKELGDTIIRCIEIAEALNLDLGVAIAETLSHNKMRPDHKVENMVKPGGKRY